MLLPLARGARAVDIGGAMLALTSGACWALYIVFGRRVGRAFGPPATALGMVIAAVVFVPIGVARAGPGLFSLDVLPSGLLLAVLSSAVPYSLEMVALTRLPVRAFGALMSLEPAIGALAGVAVLGEHPTPLQWAGIAAVIGASIGTTMTLEPQEPPI